MAVSQFVVIESAQKRGHTVYEYHVESLTLDADDRLYAQCFPVTVQPASSKISIKPFCSAFL